MRLSEKTCLPPIKEQFPALNYGRTDGPCFLQRNTNTPRLGPGGSIGHCSSEVS